MSFDPQPCRCDTCLKQKPETEGTFIAHLGRARFICNTCAPIESERETAKHYTSPLPF